MASNNYQALFSESIEEKRTFWEKQAAQLAWYEAPSQILSKDQHGYDQWFADGKLNMSYLCIDKHIEDGYGDQNAIIYDSPVTNTKEHITFLQLQKEVATLAGGLKGLGLTKGDTAIIYMPMIPQALYAMLACARLGVTHSVVFGGFAPHELALRINDCRAKAIITASSGIEIKRVIPYKPYVDQAIAEAIHKPDHVVVFDRKLGAELPQKPYDHDYETLVKNATPAEAEPVASTHPLYVLYTSGTTGTPKGIIRDTGGYATALKFSMQQISSRTL